MMRIKGDKSPLDLLQEKGLFNIFVIKYVKNYIQICKIEVFNILKT